MCTYIYIYIGNSGAGADDCPEHELAHGLRVP